LPSSSTTIRSATTIGNAEFVLSLNHVHVHNCPRIFLSIIFSESPSAIVVSHYQSSLRTDILANVPTSSYADASARTLRWLWVLGRKNHNIFFNAYFKVLNVFPLICPNFNSVSRYGRLRNIHYKRKWFYELARYCYFYVGLAELVLLCSLSIIGERENTRKEGIRG
jgi:hypothetical protein